ncbi:histidine phosphatase family protein [Streptomyces sp. NPDC059740]|uniref:histidine phosphatase family protein n=1 Tax=Streptomyces sp. NPDC059740 TaxID=3346926 RepID=UPI0036687DF1
MRLLLIRHGQTPSNVKHLLDTAVPGPGLTPLGEEQAAALPTALAGESIDALYASTLLRTQLTAAPLAARTGLEVRVRDGIRELTAGELEMRGDEEAIGTYLTTTFAWSAGDTERTMPGGESGAEALSRYDAVIDEAAGTGAATVAMVSHGAAIRMWTAARAENVDVAFASSHELQNTGVVVLSGDPRQGWRVLSWEGRSLGPEDVFPEDSGPTGAVVEPADSPVAGRAED